MDIDHYHLHHKVCEEELAGTAPLLRQDGDLTLWVLVAYKSSLFRVPTAGR